MKDDLFSLHVENTGGSCKPNDATFQERCLAYFVPMDSLRDTVLYLMVLHGTILSRRKITASFYLDLSLFASLGKEFSLKLNMNEKFCIIFSKQFLYCLVENTNVPYIT